MLTRCYCCELQVHFLGTSWNSSYYFVNEEDISTAFCAILDNNITHLFGSTFKRERLWNDVLVWSHILRYVHKVLF